MQVERGSVAFEGAILQGTTYKRNTVLLGTCLSGLMRGFNACFWGHALLPQISDAPLSSYHDHLLVFLITFDLLQLQFFLLSPKQLLISGFDQTVSNANQHRHHKNFLCIEKIFRASIPMYLTYLKSQCLQMGIITRAHVANVKSIVYAFLNLMFQIT